MSSSASRARRSRPPAAAAAPLALCVALLASAVAPRAAGAGSLLFDVEAGRTKCVGEVMTKHEVAKGGFSVSGAADAGAGDLEVTITGPGGEREYTSAAASSGKFAFTASEAGAHRVCVRNTGAGGVKRVALEWASGVDAKDYAEVAKKEHLLPIELEMRKLEDRIDGVHREMLYQREREEAHRNTSESTNARVLWYSVATIAVVVAVSALQGAYLYRFLKQKKAI